ncbi:UNVERIFIED_CONTAM: hypothetical protein Slati_3847300, partial [Sesamum latifolium]
PPSIPSRRKLYLLAQATPPSRTQRIMESLPVSGEVGGAGGAYSYNALKRLDSLWSSICNSSPVVQEPPQVVSKVPGLFQESERVEKCTDMFDVIVCGGTLGIFIATALSSKGLRVGIVEKSILRGREQEWNISRKELLELVEVGVLTEDEIDHITAASFNPVLELADGKILSSRLIIDAMGNFSPIVKQGVSLDDLEVLRVIYGIFPTYRDSPLPAAFDRVLQFGDASGIQSPVSFGGFGSLTRHLGRLSTGIHEAINSNFLDAQSLSLLNPYMVGLPVLLDWSGHFMMLGYYTFLSSYLDPVIRPLVEKFPGKMKYEWKQKLEAWKYGAGLDYEFSSSGGKTAAQD